MMKNLIKKALTILLALSLLCGIALADETDGAKKFDNVWVSSEDIRIDVYAEEGGHIIEVQQITNYEEGTGFIWLIHGTYVPDEDLIRAVSAQKWDAHLQDGELIEGEKLIYEDNENTGTFTIDENGKLAWYDSKEDIAAGMEFTAIGRYEGIWPGTNSSAEIMWSDDFYAVYVSVRNEQGQMENYMYNAFYNPEDGRLEASGTCDVVTYDEMNNETGREEINEDVEAVLYIDDNQDLVWENKAPRGVKTMTFQNQFNSSVAPESNG